MSWKTGVHGILVDGAQSVRVHVTVRSSAVVAGVAAHTVLLATTARM